VLCLLDCYWFDTAVFGLPVGPIFKGQAILIPWYETTLHCLPTQKMDNFVSTVEEALNHVYVYCVAKVVIIGKQ
jgi:hypothetical protein